MTFPSTTDYNKLSCSQRWWCIQPFLRHQCDDRITLLDSLTHLDISGVPVRHLTSGTHIAGSCQSTKHAVRLCNLLHLADLISYSPSIWSQLISHPAKGMTRRSRQCMKNVSVIKAEIIIAEFWAPHSPSASQNNLYSGSGNLLKTLLFQAIQGSGRWHCLGSQKPSPSALENQVSVLIS